MLFSAGRRKGNRKGQGLVEYAMVLVLISVVSIGILRLLGVQTLLVYNNVNGNLGAAVGA